MADRFTPVEDPDIQALVDSVAHGHLALLQAETDAAYTLDVNDCESSTSWEEGLEAGLNVASLLMSYCRLHTQVGERSREAQIFRATFPDYVEDGGVALFVGTKEEVMARISKLVGDKDAHS